MGGGKFTPEEDKTGDVSLVEKDAKKQNGDVEKDKSIDDYVAPPDGGWGWMVVFSSFLIHVIADGIVYSFGVFLMEFVDYFKSGRGATSWVGSLQPAVTFTVGPLSSALTNRYGCRKVTIAGAIIASLGFILSVFAPNLYYLYFTSGIMAGIGFGLIYLPAIVCVAQYFEKRRSFATGLAVCGSGFGTFILAPVTEMLVEEYSWQGAMLILGGIILNIVVCGIIFRPLEPNRQEGSKTPSESESEALLGTTPTNSTSESRTQNTTAQVEEVEIYVDKDLAPNRFLKDGKGGEGEGLLTEDEGLEIITSLQQQKALPNGKPKLIHGHNASSGNNHELPLSKSPETTTQSGTTSPTSDVLVMNSYHEPSAFTRDTAENKALQASVSQCLSVPNSHKNNLADMVRSDGALNRFSTHQDKEIARRDRKVYHRQMSNEASPSTLSPLSRKDIFYSGSLLNIPMYRSQPDVYKATVAAPHDHEVRSLSEKEGEEKKGGCLDMSEDLRNTMKDMLSMGLLKNPVFLMFGISNFFTSIGFNMPFIFLPDRAKLAGIDEDRAALLLSVIGIANTGGRVIFGFLSDRSWVNRLMLYNTALTICGVATALSPVVGGDYGLLVAYAAIFGVFIGVYVSLTSVVLVDLLGLEYLTNSFGLLLLFQGAATFVGPPIAGWLCDWTGSYDISFIVMGSLIAVSGCMLYFLPLVERYHARRVPIVHLVHDIELGKHVVTDDEAEIISIEHISSQKSVHSLS